MESTVRYLERQPGDIFVIAVLWLLWISSVTPLAVLFYEFGGHHANAPACVGASYYAKLYGHIFVYPATFGFLTTAFLTRPLLHTVRTINLLEEKRRYVLASLAAVIVGIVLFASWSEFTEGTPAPWSFKVFAEPEIKDESLLRPCNYLKEHERHSGVLERQDGEQKSKPLQVLVAEKDNLAKSDTEWAERVYFIGNTTVLVVLMVVVLVQMGFDDRSQIGLTVAALGSATAWVIFRLTFLMEKEKLYDQDPLLPLNYLVFIAAVVLYVQVLCLCVSDQEDRGSKVASLMGNLIVAALTCLAALFGLLTAPDSIAPGKILVQYFGVKSSPSVYITMMMLFVVVVAPPIVKLIFVTMRGASPIATPHVPVEPLDRGTVPQRAAALGTKGSRRNRGDAPR